jgi:hypothetical protein
MIDDAGQVALASDPEFSYRPLAVAEPFALGHAQGVPLSRFAEEGATTWWPGGDSEDYGGLRRASLRPPVTLRPKAGSPFIAR